ncbi:hypothetical protein [Pseudoxanthomonas wuyuanensis]
MPAYTDVWICADPRGHLQATGRDARGRKQYRYHRDWQAERGARKYDRIITFAQSLPQLRRKIRADFSCAHAAPPESDAVSSACPSPATPSCPRAGRAPHRRPNR